MRYITYYMGVKCLLNIIQLVTFVDAFIQLLGSDEATGFATSH
jgi:hypothetical protein